MAGFIVHVGRSHVLLALVGVFAVAGSLAAQDLSRYRDIPLGATPGGCDDGDSLRTGGRVQPPRTATIDPGTPVASALHAGRFARQ